MNTEQALLALLAALVLVPVCALVLACVYALARMRGKVHLDLHLDPGVGETPTMTPESGERNRLRNSVTVTPPNADAKVTASLYGGAEIPMKQESEVPDSVVAALEAKGLKVERN